MHKLLLTQIDGLSDTDLDALFAQVFNLEPLAYTSGNHDAFIFEFILEHAIKVELDKTPTKGCSDVEITLTPRQNRLRFAELRTIYYQGLDVDMDQDKSIWYRARSVTKRGKQVAPTIMRALLTLAFRDAFKDL